MVHKIIKQMRPREKTCLMCGRVGYLTINQARVYDRSEVRLVVCLFTACLNRAERLTRAEGWGEYEEIGGDELIVMLWVDAMDCYNN